MAIAAFMIRYYLLLDVFVLGACILRKAVHTASPKKALLC